MTKTSSQHDQCSPRSRSRAGFSLLDLLVAIAVIALLVGLMLPTLAAVRETARKVVCMSNIRQLSLSMGMYADTYRNELPYSRSYSKSLSDPAFDPRLLMAARLALPSTGSTNGFDGLGILHAQSFGAVPGVFYCPSHDGNTRLENFLPGWGGAPQDVYTNFQYRGGSSRGVTRLDRITDRIALISDGLARIQDFNHTVGGNVAWSDQSVIWFDDKSTQLRSKLPVASNDGDTRAKVLDAWNVIDRVETAGGEQSLP